MALGLFAGDVLLLAAGQALVILGPGMLLIWDRGFFSYELISAVVRRGAHLLARVKSNTVLRPIRRLTDGVV